MAGTGLVSLWQTPGSCETHPQQPKSSGHSLADTRTPNKTSSPPPPLPLPLFVLFFFVSFSLLFASPFSPLACCFPSSLYIGASLKAQAAARVGRPGILEGWATSPKKALDDSPSCNSKVKVKRRYIAHAIYRGPSCFAYAQLS